MSSKQLAYTLYIVIYHNFLVYIFNILNHKLLIPYSLSDKLLNRNLSRPISLWFSKILGILPIYIWPNFCWAHFGGTNLWLQILDHKFWNCWFFSFQDLEIFKSQTFWITNFSCKFLRHNFFVVGAAAGAVKGVVFVEFD